MSKYTAADIVRIVKEENIRFIRLQFTDIFGAVVVPVGNINFFRLKPRQKLGAVKRFYKRAAVEVCNILPRFKLVTDSLLYLGRRIVSAADGFDIDILIVTDDRAHVL